MTGEALPALDEARQAYRRTRALADTLVGVRRRFAGDLDQYLLYMTVAQAEVEHRLRGRPDPAGLNALSLAETCGLARETTRSKLRRMADAGLLAFSEDNLLHLADRAVAQHEYGALAMLAGRRS
jgi:hypothetical protein